VLGQLTKVPASVKEKIERIFQEASRDIAKAQELKGELDRWNVYKEYEDRFLDLFKKETQNDADKTTDAESEEVKGDEEGDKNSSNS